MSPARSMSLWLGSSASCGASFRVTREDGLAAAARENPGAHARLVALQRTHALGEARMARHLPWAEADLVPAAAGRTRFRHQPARERAPGIRRLALAQLLGPARIGDRLQ